MISKKAVAFHEAGHVVAAWIFNRRLKRATIVPDGDASGHVIVKDFLRGIDLEIGDLSPATMGRWHATTIELMAGREAQRMFVPTSIRSYQASSDNERCIDILTRLHGDGPELKAVLRYLRIRTRNLLSTKIHRMLLEAVAGALIMANTLNGPELQQVIKKAFDDDLGRRLRTKL